MKTIKDFDEVSKKITEAWDQTTIYPGLFYDSTCPARGQCEPTACLLQDIYGGIIYKIENDPSIFPKKTHYYNLIDGQFIDLTSSQFPNKIPYDKGVPITEKQAANLRTTSYCNRKVRYQCLRRNFENFDLIIKNQKAIDLRNVGYFLEDVSKLLMDAPWEEIMNWFPELFKLIVLIMDCKYDRNIGPMGNDSMRIVEHYLQGYYYDDVEKLVKEWEPIIISENGRKFQNPN